MSALQELKDHQAFLRSIRFEQLPTSVMEWLLRVSESRSEDLRNAAMREKIAPTVSGDPRG